MAKFKQLCMRCKKNYIIVSGNMPFAVCYDCQKSELDKPINDSAMKELFNIPENFYRENVFLRNIKSAYLRFGKLSEKQIAAFKKTVDKMQPKKEQL